MYGMTCPSNKTDYCIMLDEHDCTNHYMLVNSIPTKCIFHPEEKCIYNEQSCINASEYNRFCVFIFVTTTMIYSCLWLLHYKIRIEIKEKKEITDSSDCIATTCCSTCGFAQEYRELEL